MSICRGKSQKCHGHTLQGFAFVGGATLCSVILGGVRLRCRPGQPVSRGEKNLQRPFPSSDQTQQTLTHSRWPCSGRLEDFQTLSFSTFQTRQNRSRIPLPRKVQSLSLEFESVIQTSGADFFFLRGHSIIKNIQLPAICS